MLLGVSAKGGVRRYWTPEIEEKMHDLMEAEERRDAALRGTMQELFAQFAAHRDLWGQAVMCIAQLDCLISLSRWSLNGDTAGEMCRYVECGYNVSPSRNTHCVLGCVDPKC